MPPPGPVLGWLCVAHSVVDIALRAAHISCGQVLPRPPIRTTLRREEKSDASNEGMSPPAYTVKSFEASSSNQRELITKVTRPESILVTSARENYAAAPGARNKDSCSNASVSLEKSYSNLTVSKAETAQEQEPHATVSLIPCITRISTRRFFI